MDLAKVRDVVKVLLGEEDESEPAFKVGVLLYAYELGETDLTRTGYDLSLIQEVRKNCVQAGLWGSRAFPDGESWFEMGDSVEKSIVFSLQVMCAMGEIKRERRPDSVVVYSAKRGHKAPWPFLRTEEKMQLIKGARRALAARG